MSANLLRAEMSRIGASAGSVEQRAEALLGCLNQMVPYDAAWLAVRDPETQVHRQVGSEGDTNALVRYFAQPQADRELEALGLNRFRPPMPASDVPVPIGETLAWGEYLLPAGFTDGVAMPLFSDDGRHLGFLALVTGDPAHRTASYCQPLDGLRQVFAGALDRLPALGAAAALVPDAVGGVVLTRTGRTARVPTLPSHPLLEEGSATLTFARRCLTGAGASATFLSPWARSVVRVSVIDCRDESVDHLSGLVLVHPAGDALGLGRSDLRLLGALIEGWDEDRIGTESGSLGLPLSSSRLAADLGFPDVGALVRHAAREGLHLPPALWE